MKHALLLPGLVALLSAGVARADLADLVSQVSADRYRSYLDDQLFTHTGDSRWPGSPQHTLARDAITAHFSSVGLVTTHEAFSAEGHNLHNVVGVLPGLTRPDDIFIVGAHFDSVGNPGADDNASGVAGVMEAARVLSGQRYEATLVFIAFDGEEAGLYGSEAYVRSHAQDHILGMVSLDMIAYSTGAPNAVELYGRDHVSGALKTDVAAALEAYGGLTVTIRGAMDSSDHAPFEWQGIPATLAIEQADNPYYHRPTDTVDQPGYLDYELGTRVTQGMVGWLATEAVLVAVPEPTGTLWLGLVVLGLVGSRRRWF